MLPFVLIFVLGAIYTHLRFVIPSGSILPMKNTPSSIAAREFLALTGLSARKLALEAGINPVILTRVLSGTRRDMRSENADRLRAAMERLSDVVPAGETSAQKGEVSA